MAVPQIPGFDNLDQGYLLSVGLITDDANVDYLKKTALPGFSMIKLPFPTQTELLLPIFFVFSFTKLVIFIFSKSNT